MNCLILLNCFLFSRCLIVVLFDKTRSALLFVSFLDCNAFFKINSFSCSSSISPTGFKSDTLTNSVLINLSFSISIIRDLTSANCFFNSSIFLISNSFVILDSIDFT